MKTQIYIDGNKRAAVIFANHFLISHGAGVLIIPESEVPQFKRLLVAYYENRDKGDMTAFMKNKCIKRVDEPVKTDFNDVSDTVKDSIGKTGKRMNDLQDRALETLKSVSAPDRRHKSIT